MLGSLVEPDVAAALLDDPVGRGQAKSGSRAALVVKNGSKTRALVSSSMPTAGVGDLQEGVRAGLDADVLPGVDLVERHVGGVDCQRASRWHRVAGVHREVEDHLSELAAVTTTGLRSGSSSQWIAMSSLISRCSNEGLLDDELRS